MPATQIYEIVNSVVQQATGETALTVVDETGLIALGNTVLSSATNTNNFINTLVDRIGRTIFSYRQYTNKFSNLMRTDFEWGAVLQKIKVEMPKAEADESFDLEDGTAVDMFKVAKPKAKQKLFYTQTPYQFKITITRERLKDAFISESAMGAFIQSIYGEVQNAIELSMEDLGRICLNNFIAEVSGKAREIKLVTLYNAIYTEATVTAETALYNESFLRFAIKVMKAKSKGMTDMSQLFNDGSTKRHTPLDLQNLYVLTDFELALETSVLYSAFNKEFVSLPGYNAVNFWQASQSPSGVHVKRASDSADTEVNNVMAVLVDREALGIYKHDEWTSTTPFNSAGGYTNTYWHHKELYFNDLSENGLIFTLN